MLASTGEITPPCGVPVCGWITFPSSSSIPARSHLRIRFSIAPSAILCTSIRSSHSHWMLSKNPLMSASTTKWCPPNCNSWLRALIASCALTPGLVAIAARQKIHLVYRQQDLRHCHLQQLVLQHRNAQRAQFPVALGDVFASHQPRSICLALQPPLQVCEVAFQVLFILLERHPVHATGCVLSQAKETQAQNVSVEPPIQVAEAVVFVGICLLGYGPQEGLPVSFRRSYGAGCLCGLRCSVGSFASVGPVETGLPLATMGRSDSRSARRRCLS